MTTEPFTLEPSPADPQPSKLTLVMLRCEVIMQLCIETSKLRGKSRDQISEMDIEELRDLADGDEMQTDEVNAEVFDVREFVP